MRRAKPPISVRANCPTCGDVSITNHDLVVRVCVDTDTAAYQFWCPSCRFPVVKECGRQIRELLVAEAGVRVRSWYLPLEMFELKVGEPLTLDDSLSFHESIDAELEALR